MVETKVCISLANFAVLELTRIGRNQWLRSYWQNCKSSVDWKMCAEDLTSLQVFRNAFVPPPPLSIEPSLLEAPVLIQDRPQ